MSRKSAVLVAAIAFVAAMMVAPFAWAAGGEGAASEPASVPALTLGQDGEAGVALGGYDDVLEPAVPSSGAGTTSWTRLSGKTQFDTMRKIVADGWAASAGGTAIVATSASFPDALSASGVAGVYGAPVLLTEANVLTAQTKAELQRLKPARVIVAGGKFAISDGVLSAIRTALPKAEVKRLKGATASGTAAALNKSAYAPSKSATAILATSLAFQDALSAAPVAFAKKYPVFLADGMDSISVETIDAMKACGVKKVIVVGGMYAVSQKVVDKMKANGISLATRLSGKTAYDTSSAIATYAVKSLGMKATRTGVATGKAYTDALCGAALCGKRNAPLVLIDLGQITAASNFVGSFASSIKNGYIFGGKYAVSADIVHHLDAMLHSYVDVPFKSDLKNLLSLFSINGGMYAPSTYLWSEISTFKNGSNYLYYDCTKPQKSTLAGNLLYGMLVGDQYRNIFNKYGVGQIGNTSERGYEGANADPQRKFANPYYGKSGNQFPYPSGSSRYGYRMYNASSVDWIARNIFNSSSGDISVLRSQSSVKAQTSGVPQGFYYHGGRYYTSWSTYTGGPISSYFISASNLNLPYSWRYENGYYYVKWSGKDIESKYRGTFTAKLSLKDVDGKTYWTLHSNKKD